MPLFFLIAIGCGAFTVGATAVDVTSDARMQNRDRTAQVQTQTQAQPQVQASAYTTDSGS